MRVALVYDEPGSAGPDNSVIPEDLGAEYEDPTAIAAMLETLAGLGHEAVGVPFGEDFPARVRHAAPDVAFNIAEGVRGPVRESIVPAWLDHLGIPYTGSDGLTLALSLDKAWTKRIVAAEGIATPQWRRARSLEDLAGLRLDYPLFVKPNAEGSSMGIRYASRVETPEALRERTAWVLDTYGEDALIEEFAPGAEYCVALLGDEPEVLPLAEVRSHGGFYSFEDKSRHEKQVLCPADLEPRTAQALREAGLRIFGLLRCRDLARIDFKVDARGRPSFLEINPLPGLAPDYGIYTAQAQAAGIAYDTLIGRLIDLAARRAPRVPGEVHA